MPGASGRWIRTRTLRRWLDRASENRSAPARKSSSASTASQPGRRASVRFPSLRSLPIALYSRCWYRACNRTRRGGILEDRGPLLVHRFTDRWSAAVVMTSSRASGPGLVGTARCGSGRKTPAVVGGGEVVAAGAPPLSLGAGAPPPPPPDEAGRAAAP